MKDKEKIDNTIKAFEEVLEKYKDREKDAYDALQNLKNKRAERK